MGPGRLDQCCHNHASDTPIIIDDSHSLVGGVATHATGHERSCSSPDFEAEGPARSEETGSIGEQTRDDCQTEGSAVEGETGLVL